MITFQRVPVMTGSADREGCVIFADGQLTAVVVRLDACEHGHLRGKWFLEAGIGPCNHPAPLFDLVDDALAWVASRISN